MGANDLPPGTPGWIVLAVFVTIGLKYLGQFLSEASETWAKFLGPLGRRWRERGAKRQQERAATNDGQVASLESDVRFYRARSRRFEAQHGRFLEWYHEVDAPFHTDVSISAAETGCRLPKYQRLSDYMREHPVEFDDPRETHHTGEQETAR